MSLPHARPTPHNARLPYLIRFPAFIRLADRFDEAQPVCLGMSLYTYRVRGLEAYFNRVKASAVQITEIVCNEFGEQSFSFVAPDEYFWTLLEIPIVTARSLYKLAW